MNRALFGDPTERRGVTFEWNDVAIATLERMLGENASYLDIANELGVSRNAVIGKASRLGLKSKNRPSYCGHGARTKGPAWDGESLSILRTMWQIGANCETIRNALPGAGRSLIAIKKKANLLRLRRPIKVKCEKVREIRMDRKPRSFESAQIAIPESRRLTIFELRATTCRWPIGTPGEEGFCFCGADAPVEHPYCPQHHAIAYVGKTPRYTAAERAEFERSRRIQMARAGL